MQAYRPYQMFILRADCGVIGEHSCGKGSVIFPSRFCLNYLLAACAMDAIEHSKILCHSSCGLWLGHFIMQQRSKVLLLYAQPSLNPDRHAVESKYLLVLLLLLFCTSYNWKKYARQWYEHPKVSRQLDSWNLVSIRLLIAVRTLQQESTFTRICASGCRVDFFLNFD